MIRWWLVSLVCATTQHIIVYTCVCIRHMWHFFHLISVSIYLFQPDTYPKKSSETHPKRPQNSQVKSPNLGVFLGNRPDQNPEVRPGGKKPVNDASLGKSFSKWRCFFLVFIKVFKWIGLDCLYLLCMLFLRILSNVGVLCCDFPLFRSWSRHVLHGFHVEFQTCCDMIIFGFLDSWV